MSEAINDAEGQAHVVMFSGGVGSWAAAKRVAERHGASNLHLVFADTMMEDEDLYRFINEAVSNIGGQFHRLADGRTPWDVFRDTRFLGNTRADPCSRILKRELLRTWLEETFSPDTATVYLGIDWTEIHRLSRVESHWKPWTVVAPMCEAPLVSKSDMLDQLKREGIDAPRLYGMGFPHNNCGGFCIKAGQAHFRLLLLRMPERYAEHERAEEKLRQYLGKDVAILRDRRGGDTKPLTLRMLRERLEKDDTNCDLFEWGGCGCLAE